MGMTTVILFGPRDTNACANVPIVDTIRPGSNELYEVTLSVINDCTDVGRMQLIAEATSIDFYKESKFWVFHIMITTLYTIYKAGTYSLFIQY